MSALRARVEKLLSEARRQAMDRPERVHTILVEIPDGDLLPGEERVISPACGNCPALIEVGVEL